MALRQQTPPSPHGTTPQVQNRCGIWGLLLLCLIYTLHFTLPVKADHPPPQLKDGVIDLTGWNFNGSEPLRIKGEVDLIWGEFVAPEEVDARKAHKLIIPSRWDDLAADITGDDDIYHGHATIRMTLLLPDTDDLSLLTDNMRAAHRLYINGALFRTQGYPGESLKEEVQNARLRIFPLPTDTNTLTLVFHLSHYSGAEGAGNFRIFIGKRDSITTIAIQALTQATILPGALISLTAFGFALFIGRREEKSFLFFSLLCLTAAGQMAFTQQSLPLYVPGFPEVLAWKLDSVFAILLGPVFYLFLHQYFPNQSSRVIALILVSFFGIIALTMLFKPLPLMPFSRQLTVSSALISSVLCMLTVIRAILSGERNSRVIMVGVSFAVFGGINDVLSGSLIIDTPFMAPYGVTIMMIVFSVTLARRVNAFIRENQALTHNLEDLVTERTRELAAAREKAEQLARLDELTQLFNRRAFFEEGNRLFDLALRHGHSMTVVFFDLDRFKLVNDTYGHAVGDDVLKIVAANLRRHIRSSDIAARIGGEEFTILLPETSLQDAELYTERLRSRIEQAAIEVEGQPISITASFGIAPLRQDSLSLEAIMDQADKAAYASKEAGRNRVTVSDAS